MDFADSVNEQRRSLPAGMDWSTWDAYFRYCYRNSHVLRRYVDANLAFYPDYTLAPLGYIVVRHPLDGQVLSTWIAREVLLSDSTQPAGHDDDLSLLLQRFKLQPADLPPRGYPWVTSWVFSTYRGPDVEPEPEVLMSVRVVNEREAEVTTRSMSRIDEEGAATLRSWVVDGMRGVGLDFVHFHQAGEVHRYDLVKLGLSGRRTFELPRFRSHH